ncbi:hypothetical protein DLM75_23730 [Leptospira stimsonii]|uniref:Uncharacterized protein n=1 Tax=Leptospira stimsonii TaxID=2202203 RepID=A0A396YKE5_9LEPT|nr:hypothetical protein DLM75_23730 [Leptospira stimsonii]
MNKVHMALLVFPLGIVFFIIFLYTWIRIGIWIYWVIYLNGIEPNKYRELRTQKIEIMESEKKMNRAFIYLCLFLIIFAISILFII